MLSKRSKSLGKPFTFVQRHGLHHEPEEEVQDSQWDLPGRSCQGVLGSQRLMVRVSGFALREAGRAQQPSAH